jgi:S-adenosyl-L-methionine hydrolase (adenosine-forming)
MSLIALITDFGTRDHYVGVMKGVILQIDPKANIVDISHEIDPQDLYHGAFVLRQCLPYFPAGTIFVAVVDPTVGTSRRILAARYNDRMVLAPDNGLLTFVHRDMELQDIRVVENRRFFASTISGTFHGRDIFAPVAAHLSRGVGIANLGPVPDRIELFDIARPRILPDSTLEGTIVLADRFGNLITNISEADIIGLRVRRAPEVYAGAQRMPLGPILHTYGEAPAGSALALMDSSRMLEIAVNGGSAARKLDLRRGDPILVH